MAGRRTSRATGPDLAGAVPLRAEVPVKSILTRALVVVGVIACASVACAETWSIGPSIGLDLVSSEGSRLIVMSAPTGQNVVVPSAAPGLRIAATSRGGHHVGFLDTS